MNSEQKLQKLQQVLEPELREMVANTIMSDGDRYLVFGDYTMDRSQHGWTVMRTRRDPQEFASGRTALSWCIADKYQQYHVAAEIARLDREKSLLTDDIHTRSALRKQVKDLHKKEAIDAKLHARRSRLETVQTRLDKYVSLAKYWQIRGFNNETARTGRTPSHKTNR